MKRPYCVALTGGIGSGKSRVADCFSRFGVEVVDTDLIARELTAPDSPILADLAEAFGQDILGSDGSLDRAKLRQRVFSDAAQRKRLEGLLHPRIRDLAGQRVRSAKSAYVLLVVPLLVESGAYWDLADRVLVVDCDTATQVERVMKRDGVDRASVEATLSAQASRPERLARADDVIDNQEAGMNLDAVVAELHADYLKRAATSLPLQ